MELAARLLRISLRDLHILLHFNYDWHPLRRSRRTRPHSHTVHDCQTRGGGCIRQALSLARRHRERSRTSLAGGGRCNRAAYCSLRCLTLSSRCSTLYRLVNSHRVVGGRARSFLNRTRRLGRSALRRRSLCHRLVRSRLHHALRQGLLDRHRRCRRRWTLLDLALHLRRQLRPLRRTLGPLPHQYASRYQEGCRHGHHPHQSPRPGPCRLCSRMRSDLRRRRCHQFPLFYLRLLPAPLARKTLPGNTPHRANTQLPDGCSSLASRPLHQMPASTSADEILPWRRLASERVEHRLGKSPVHPWGSPFSL